MRKLNQTSFQAMEECPEMREWPWSQKVRNKPLISYFTLTKILNLSQAPPLSLENILNDWKVLPLETIPRQ